MISKVLGLLTDNMRHAVSGSEIGAKLGISRVAVGKYIKKLKSEGYEIVSSTNTGHRLISLPDAVDGVLLTSLCGVGVKCLTECESTNIVARELAGSTGIDIVAAVKQTAGRGRKGRAFESGEGGAYFSVITRRLNPPLAVGRAMLVSLAAGIAVYDTVKGYGAQDVMLKYPNDVLIGGRKVCGILTETLSDGDFIEWAVTGIGINVNNDLPAELQDIAINLRTATTRQVNVALVIAEVFQRFCALVEDMDTVVDRYKQECAMVGADITVIEADRSYIARAVDINADGYLIIQEDNVTKYAVGCDLSYRPITE